MKHTTRYIPEDHEEILYSFQILLSFSSYAGWLVCNLLLWLHDAPTIKTKYSYHDDSPMMLDGEINRN